MRSLCKLLNIGLVALMMLSFVATTAAVTQPVGAAVAPALGVVDPATNFPAWYRDTNGVPLELCLDGAPNCVAAAADLVAPDGEAFYFNATTDLTTSGGKSLLVLGTESAFAAAGIGQESVFNRTRIRINTSQPGAFTVTWPYGQKTYDVADVAAGKFEINETVDLGCIAAPPDNTCNDAKSPNFADVRESLKPFLTWDTGAPAGFIGDAATPHKVAGSPLGTNVFRVQGPAINPTPAVDGCPTLTPKPAGYNPADCLENALFVVQGKLAGPLVSEPTRAEFAAVQDVNTSATQSVTIKNVGATAVTVNPAAFAVTGPSAGDFAVDSTTCTTLTTDATCTVTVRFTPTEGGFRSATLSITHDGVLHSPVLVPLAGIGRGTGSVSIEPAGGSIDFQTVHVGGTESVAAPKRVTVTNTSATASVTIGKVSLGGANAGEFQIVGGGAAQNCVAGTVVAPGASCTIAVAFAPAHGGSRSALLSITEDADSSARNVELTGVGDQGIVHVGPVDSATHFPKWYEDKTGRKLENCLDGLPVCFAAASDLVAPDGEAFFFNANTQIDLPSGGRIGLVLGVESAYAGSGAGQEITFNRVRFFATSGLTTGTLYKVTHPYGVDTYIATGDAAEGGVRRVDGTQDIGCLLPAPTAPCTFTDQDDPVLTSRGGPFLQWDPAVAPAPPTGYIGDGAAPHRVTGSPYNTNYLRVQELNQDGTLKAGGLDVQTSDFVVQGKILGPGPVVASPKGGQFATPQQVKLSVSDAMENSDLVDNDGAKIYYTTNGTTPTTASALYTGPITVNTSMTLKFIAVNAKGGATKTASESYVLGAQPVTVTASPKGGVYATAQMVTLTPSDPGATIYYTEDGSTPSTTLDTSEAIAPAPGSVKYVPGTQINVAASKTLKFIGVNSGGGLPPVGSETYTIGSDRSAVGPVQPVAQGGDGFPQWYQDTTGLRLEKCFDPAICFAALPDTAAPLAFPTNYPEEVFYWAGRALMTSGGGGKASLILGTEAAFVPGPGAADGQQITFNRIRIKASGLTPGATYTVTHPYGVETLTANTLGVILFTEDIGCGATPCDFGAALDGRNTPWLRWDAADPAPPAGYIGDAAADHTVVGSPFGTNVFRIAGPNAGGSGVNSVETNLFSIQGKISTAATVAASPKGGLYNAAQSVTLTATDGTIRYTTDGTTPTATTGTLYSVPIAIAATTTLKFVAVDAAGTAGQVATEVYTIDTVAPTVAANPAGGAFTSAQSVALTASEPGTIYYTTDGTTPSTTTSPVYSSPITIGSTTTLKFVAVDRAGNASAAVGSETYTINLANDTTPPTVAANPAGGAFKAAQSVTLTASEAGAIYFTTDGSAPTTASTKYSTPVVINTLNATTTLKFLAVDVANNQSPMQTEVYTIDTVAPTVAANPAGGVFNTAQSVALTTPDATAKIYYTTDGTAPSASSTRYSAAIPVGATTTLKFVAIDPAGNQSAVGTETYTIDTVAVTVSASPAGGSFTSAQSVILTASKTGAKVYYTTNGTTPTASSTLYSAPIAVGATTTLKFLAIDTAGNSSAVGTEVYTITIPPTATAPKQSLIDSKVTVAPALANSTVPVQLAWSGGGNIAKYELQESVNGGAFAAVALPTATATSIARDLKMGSLAAPLTYKYQVRACDSAAGTNCSAWAVGSLFSLGIVDNEDTARIAYSGSWKTATVVGAYGGTVRFATQPGPRAALNKITFTIPGSAALVTTMGPDRGQASVSIDGAPAKIIDLYSPTLQTARIPLAAIENDISAGTHTIVFTVLGTKNAASAGVQVDVDAAIVIR
jgi:Chitobiase/beta-hexosaminidase C-terminal domain/Abnormal spindle-like microcephaly-assoc'd, ASPM-SPD-2-Hydin